MLSLQRSRGSKRLLLKVLGSLLLCTPAWRPPAAQAEPPASAAAKAKVVHGAEGKRDPRAMHALQAMTDYLRSLPAFSVRAEITRDEVVQKDFKLERTTHLLATAKRPDRLRAELSGDDGERLITYDGKTLNVFAKDENYYGTVSAPETLKEALDTAVERHSIDMPLVDIFYLAMGGDVREVIDAAGYVGTTMLDGTACDHVAFRSEKVDWQLWIEKGAQAVPHKMVVTTRDDATKPQYRASMTWNVDPKIVDGMFAFTPPKGTLPMTMGLEQPALLDAVGGTKATSPKRTP